MKEQDARRIREAFDRVIAAVAEIDPAAPPAVHQELATLGDRREGMGRTLTSMATARLTGAPAPGDDGPDRLSHPAYGRAVMHVQDASGVRDALDRVLAAFAVVDLDAMVPTTHREVVTLAERIERAARTMKSRAAAKVAESAAWQGDGDRTRGGLAGPHHRHHPGRGGQGAAVRARSAGRPGGRPGGCRG